jgi:predicted DCC family thiol-disulfide oxidoreductase YuxK
MKTIALYDQTCSLCRETKRIFNKLDWFGKVEWISLQEYEKEKSHIAFQKEDLRKELHIITPSNQVIKGFYAVRRLFVLFPATFPLGILVHFPLIDKIGIPVYQWVAKNRHKFSRKNCDSGSCSL